MSRIALALLVWTAALSGLAAPAWALTPDRDVAKMVSFGGVCVGCELSGRRLTGATFMGAKFDRSTLVGADLRGASFHGSSFVGADFTRADVV